MIARAIAVVPLLLASAPKHSVPPPARGGVVVALCDGKTTVEVDDARDGVPLSRERAQSVANQLMTGWRKNNPAASWDGPVVALAQQPPARARPEPVRGGGETAESGALGIGLHLDGGVQSGHTYGAYSERDLAIWAASTDEVVQRGKNVFHDAKELGGTIGVSCDMCHPNAANTHPETYPKYQVQLGRVALLRDMINWCIENPLRARPLHDDDERLRAMEAYILAQRKGVPLEYGKH